MKRLLVSFVFSVFFVLFSQTVTAQEYDTRTTPIVVNSGSSLFPNNLLKDSKGFLWYSMQDGLIKEMGNHSIYYPYKHPTEKDIPISPKLFEIKNGSIIGVSNQGFFLLNPITGVLDWLFTPKPKTIITFNSLKEDAKGNIWVGANNGIIYCYTTNHEILRHKINGPFENQNPKLLINVMDILDDGSVIIKRNEVWYRYYNNKTELIIDVKQPNKKNRAQIGSDISANGAFFSKNRSGKFWLEGKQYNYIYIPEIDRQIFQFPYLELKILNPSKTENKNKKSRIIASSRTQLKIFKIDTSNVFHLKNEFSFNNVIRSYIIDSTNNIWINTIDGITSAHLFKKPFTPIIFNERGEGLEKNISCRGITKTKDGTIYIYTYHGWFELKKNADSFQKIAFFHENTKKPMPEDIALYSFYKQNDSVFWAHGYSYEIFRLDVLRRTYREFSLNRDSLFVSQGTYNIDQLNDKTLLVTGGFGMIEFDMITHQVKGANQLNNDINLTNKNVYVTYIDRQKNELWLGLLEQGGLYKKDITTGEVTHYYKGSKSTPLVDNSVTVIVPDGDDVLWIGTENGLQKLNTKTLNTKTYKIKDGFKNTFVAGILLEEEFLWVSTYNGLVRLNKETGETNIYFKKDGLPNNEFNKKSFLKVSNDSLLFGGISGLVSFNPEKIENENRDHNLFLAQVIMYDEKIDSNYTQSNSLHTVQSFRIPYSNNYLHLKFAINDILYPEKNTYRYRIKGLSKDWSSLGNNDELRLLGIIPGNYILQLQGYNSNGEATNILSYNLIIEQVFYKKIWFFILCFLVFVGFILGWGFYKRRSLKVKHKQQNEFNLLETKALRAQMNPHFIFNTLNGIQSVMILQGEQAANKYLVSFSKLLRFTLDMNSLEFISLKNEINYLKSYLELESLRLNHNIEYIFDVSNDIDNINIPCMLFQPIIENAIIHGLLPKKEDRKLHISMTLKNDILIGKVTDNGIGRDASQIRKKKNKANHKSWATHIMNERINISNSLHKEKISFEIIDLKQGEKSIGTEAILYIFIKKDEY